jgi:signal transduction histidine kinase
MIIPKNRVDKTISKLTFRKIAVSLLLINFIIAICTYWYSYVSLKTKTLYAIEEYLKERVEREVAYFTLAEKNINTFSIIMEKNLSNNMKQVEDDFSKKFVKLPNGVIRNKDYQNPFDTQAYIPAGLKLTPLIKKVLTNGHQNLSSFGYAWSSAFMNIWLVGKEGYALSFTPTAPHSLHFLPAHYSFRNFESVSIGLPENNPNGIPRWSRPFFDKTLKEWVIAYTLPFYHKGKFLFSLGIDFPLDEIDRRMLNNSVKGTYTILFDSDGRLVSHPKYGDKIKKTNGEFNLLDSDDATLKFISSFKETKHEKVQYISLEKHFIGLQKVGGTNWYLAIIYPESILSDYSRKLAVYVSLIGILFLIIELIIMTKIIKRNIKIPINQLIDGVKEITSGNFDAKVDVNSSSELGLLSDSFNEMTTKLKEQQKIILAHQQDLETQIEKRTRELDQQRAEVYNASRLASLGEMAGRIAHEINNPLTIILLGVDSIRKHSSKDELGHNFSSTLDKIDLNSNRISEIVKGMHDLSESNEHLKFKSERLDVLIEKTLLLCEETLAMNHIQINVSPIPDVIIDCNIISINQILLNLIQNSIDALNNSSVRIIDIGFEKTDNLIKILIKNTGRLISPEIQEKIFDPFFTTKDVGEGVGLGLFISMSLAKANRGRLYYDKHSKRTKFILELPLMNLSS